MSQLPEGATRHYFDGAACRLSAVEFRPNATRTAVLVHGMRDHALCLLPIVEALADHRVITVDLRGHGHSDNPGSYALIQFVADLKAAFDHFHVKSGALIGHSLGGHIGALFTATYPELVESLVLVDGMGPPRVEEPEDMAPQRGREFVDLILNEVPIRPMTDVDEAARRLRRYSPMLSEDMAKLIATHGTEPIGDGLRWRWDAKAAMVWMTFSPRESETAWRNIRCPTLVVTGDRGLDYWVENRPQLAGLDDFYERDLVARCEIISNAQQLVIDDAGHMVHYDQPQRLAGAVKEFVDTVSSR